MDQFIGWVLMTYSIFIKPCLDTLHILNLLWSNVKIFEICSMDPRKEKYLKLMEQLTDGFDWPTIYMFKFIVPADNAKIAQVENLFNSEEAQISIRNSRKGNFVSITGKELMMSPEKVIERYLEAEDIEGLISL